MKKNIKLANNFISLIPLCRYNLLFFNIHDYKTKEKRNSTFIADIAL
jgi:hypothetical protein